MKKVLFSFIAITVLIAGCSSGKYADKIDKAVKAQEKYQTKLAKGQKGDVKKKFDKKDANIYVYKKGKYVTLAYKPLKGDAEAHYYTYKFNNNKPKLIKNFNSKGYVEEHKADYKEENMNKN